MYLHWLVGVAAVLTAVLFTHFGGVVVEGRLVSTTTTSSRTNTTSNLIETIWTLPLDLQPIPNTGKNLVVADHDTVYAVDARGTLFAVRALDGKLLWSYSGHATVYNLQLYPQIPDMVYYVTVDPIGAEPDNFTVRAIRKADGAHVGTIHNMTNSVTAVFGEAPAVQEAPLRYSGGGLVGLHVVDGNFATISGFDHTLNRIRWQSTSGGAAWWNATSQASYVPQLTHIAANEDIVFSIYTSDYYQWPAEHNYLVSWDARTGAVRCNMSNLVTTTGADLYGIALNSDNKTILQYRLSKRTAGGSGATLGNFLVDVNLCTNSSYHFHSELFGGQVVGGTQWLNNTFSQYLEDKENNNTVTAQLSDVGAETALWTQTFPTDGPGTYKFKFTVGQLVSDLTTLVLWWAEGNMTALNRADGTIRWQLPQRVPILPPNNHNQYTFPLSSHLQFIPNFEGYTLFDVHAQKIVEVSFERPIGAAFSFPARDEQQKSSVVVVVDVLSGSLASFQLAP